MSSAELHDLLAPVLAALPLAEEVVTAVVRTTVWQVVDIDSRLLGGAAGPESLPSTWTAESARLVVADELARLLEANRASMGDGPHDEETFKELIAERSDLYRAYEHRFVERLGGDDPGTWTLSLVRPEMAVARSEPTGLVGRLLARFGILRTPAAAYPGVFLELSHGPTRTSVVSARVVNAFTGGGYALVLDPAEARADGSFQIDEVDLSSLVTAD